MNIEILLEFGLLLLSIQSLHCEVFSSIIDVEALIFVHENVYNNLRQYIHQEEKRLHILKRYKKLFSEEYKKAKKDAQKYIDNPIHAFNLIKRLTIDFEDIKQIASEPTEYVWERELVYPSGEDLTGAAASIARIQRTYQLNSTDLLQSNMSEGFRVLMSANDCYHLAQKLFAKKEYGYAAEWFKEALEKLTHDRMVHNFDRNDEIENIRKYYNKAVKKRDYAEKHNKNKSQIIFYGDLCRGEVAIPTVLSKDPFLKLAAIKGEKLYKDPDVFIYHDVLTDSEIEILKELAAPKLKRAKVASDDGNGKTSKIRIGKCAWLYENSTITKRVMQRTSDITGLSMTYTEPLQIANYGIGGYYSAHYDAINDPKLNCVAGDRIATVLFYMSNVKQGGLTVFPWLSLAVKPQKGSALFWMNLHPTGGLEDRSLHAACPVLFGCKWVANLWIRQAGQELLRPCPHTFNKYWEMYKASQELVVGF